MSGDVDIIIVDGGAGIVSVPLQSVQLVIAPSSGGTANQIVATRNPNTLASFFTGGPLVEAGGLTINAGGTVLAMRAATATPGAASAVTMQRVGTSTSVVTVTGTPVDEFYVIFKVAKGGTVAADGIKFQLSLDAGRTYGPVIALGTPITYLIPGTGLTLHFAAGTLDTGDKAVFGTTPPITDAAGVSSCLDVFRASDYGKVGVGSSHIVTPFSGANQATIETYLDTLATKFVYTRAITELRDASPLAIWGGTAEAEAAWMTSIESDVSALSAKRICPNAGAYNMTSPFRTPVCGIPRYRRNLAWALAARQVTLPPQRHAGRVRDGALSAIQVDPTSDPGDGFVYHDEFENPGLELARICAARKRTRPGYYIAQPKLASPAGSVFTILPFGNVMDQACYLVHQVGEDEINEDIQLKPNGTIDEGEAQSIERTMLGVLNVSMTNKKEISGATVVVNRSENVRATSNVPIDVTIFGRGYVLSETVNIGFASAFGASGGV